MNTDRQTTAEGLNCDASWFAPPPVATHTVEFAPAALPQTIELRLDPIAAPAVTSQTSTSLACKVVSIAVPRTRAVVKSFCFAPAANDHAPAAPPATSRPAGAAVQRTPIRPPSDVIKLADRLAYILQPSLEALLAERELDFPFQPFGYQMQGVAFLYPRQAAVLADEMGLGKTMQTITAIRLLLRRGELRSVLLICPKPLVSNWQREFSLWAPEIPLLAIEGDQAKRHWQWQLPDVPLRIANYELVCRDRELLDGDQPGAPQFDLVVLDESQRIKNRASTTSQVVRSIGRGRSWALTGTPVENSPADLVGIFEFLAPGFLSIDMKPRRMGRTASDYILRRTKEQVLTELPPKLIHDAALELTGEQRAAYSLAEDDGVVRLNRLGQELTIQHVFELVLRLKQICNFDPATGASAKADQLEADLEEVAASGRKAIVFSQWVQTLDRLAERLKRFGPLCYHGQVPHRRRDGIIQQFRDDPRSQVILMSYGAGGVGLNLQFAGYVFLFDRWWNPAVEDQAINRAHRIGASGPVTVTRFLSADTIEERINAILEEKRALFDVVLSGAEPHRNLGLSQREIFGLFQLRGPQGPVTAAA